MAKATKSPTKKPALRNAETKHFVEGLQRRGEVIAETNAPLSSGVTHVQEKPTKDNPDPLPTRRRFSLA